jgi:protein-tyrosine phosphatase
MAERLNILLVCTGNTCRSPMAQALTERVIAEKLGVGPDELAGAGVVVRSAGVAAGEGSPASPEAIAVLGEDGIDLSDHQSQAVSDRLIEEADVIYTMTGRHREVLVNRWPRADDKTLPLNPDGDIHDPIGGDEREYRETARLIRWYLQERLEALDALRALAAG